MSALIKPVHNYHNTNIYIAVSLNSLEIWENAQNKLERSLQYALNNSVQTLLKQGCIPSSTQPNLC